MKKNIIFGMQFKYVASSTEEYEKFIMSADCAIDNEFLQTYGDYKTKMQIVAECAKVYIYNNWKKVKDWSCLSVVIEDNSDKPTEYHNHIPRKVSSSEKGNNPRHSKLVNKIGEERHNPVKSIDTVILDLDGDFSLTINGKKHLWIGDDSIVIIADYIEKTLREKNVTV